MKSFYITDAGKVRSHNEDSVAIVKNGLNERLLMVADGMGGHRAGEIASNIAITYLSQKFKNLSSIGSKLDAVHWLDENVAIINKKILDYAKTNPEALGLGTTLVLALLTENFLIFGNIGDSSGYVFKNGKLTKVTKDHTFTNVLLESGELTEEQALNHPKKNVLMRALGAGEKQELDKFVVESDIDGVFLCSDGLTNMLSKEQIESILNDEDLEIENKLAKLVKKCNSRGGLDNISIAYLVKESK